MAGQNGYVARYTYFKNAAGKPTEMALPIPLSVTALKYLLSIRHPVGTSVRRESVQETEPGNPKLSGVFQQTFDIEGGKLLVIYMAGQNGYFANYRYTATGKPMDIPFAILGLSPNLLKSAAG
ncbi:CG43131 [Drosophila busckii]|uniref:CG43131 n=1 Tax=Drosophila busckii TaxID=30019 RepID=A0A0M4E8E0_DROBS|nr:CG43131 [Drosophila busckii]